MLWMALSLVAGGFLLGREAQAFETDQLTNRQVAVLDSDEPISLYVTEMIDRAVADTTEKAARHPERWSPDDVALELRRQLAQENPFNFHHFGARIEVWLKKDLAPRGYGHYPEMRGETANIYMYRDLMYGSVMDEGPEGGMSVAGFILNLADAMSGTVVAPTFIVGGARFGGDKLSHFFRLGYRYWKKSLREAGVEVGEARAIRYGTKTEIGHLGYLTTGIFSYADLAANYAGFQFFRRLAGTTADCEGICHLLVHDDLSISWNRSFRASDYVSVDWDEWLNQSAYNSGVRRGIRAYAREYGGELCTEYAIWKPQFEVDRLRLTERSVYVDPEFEPAPYDGEPVADLENACAGVL